MKRVANLLQISGACSTGSTLNALDKYLVTCIVMVFLALLEYAIILFAMHVSEK